jgi:thioredoxin-related protein
VKPVAFLLCLLFACSLGAPRALAADPGDPTFALPSWFTETFLDFREDVADAAKQGKRVMIYFGQDGCPYCKRLIQVNFSQKTIVDKARAHFVSIPLDIWGDREVTWTDGSVLPEKRFAAFLKVQFTPTLVFLDERARVVARVNGYYPPHRLEAVLDWVAGRMEEKVPLAEYLKTAAKDAASPALHEEPFFMKRPSDLRRRGGRPLAVLFETPSCAGCDELHREAFRRADVQALLSRFDVARFDPYETTRVTTPDARALAVFDWTRALGLAYTPAIVLFGADGAEALRIESYVRPFHLASALEYVASGAYRREPSFQRFIQERAARMRSRGDSADLWK